jgi:hypothetical protein
MDIRQAASGQKFWMKWLALSDHQTTGIVKQVTAPAAWSSSKDKSSAKSELLVESFQECVGVQQACTVKKQQKQATSKQPATKQKGRKHKLRKEGRKVIRLNQKKNRSASVSCV